MKRVLGGCLRSVLVSACGLALVLTAAALLMLGILAADQGLPQSDEAYIAGIIGVDLPEYSGKSGEDTHGGFHGDGSAWYVYDFEAEQAAQLLEQIEASPHWHSLSASKKVGHFLFGGEEDGISYAAHAGAAGFALPDEGYWFISDEQAEGDARYSDADFLNRHSINVKCAVYDAAQGRLLFYELDT